MPDVEPNRRMRTRMSGGVRGGADDPLLLLDFQKEVDEMHNRMFVTVGKGSGDGKIATPQEAISFVQDYLNENSFCGSAGRWGGGLADYYCVGGTWSGELTRARLDAGKVKALRADLDAAEREWTRENGDYPKWMAKRSSELEAKYFSEQELPRSASPLFYRDSWSAHEYDDDAAIVDDPIYEQLLKPYEGLMDSDEFVDVDFEACSQAFVGNKWVVVIDYHC